MLRTLFYGPIIVSVNHQEIYDMTEDEWFDVNIAGYPVKSGRFFTVRYKYNTKEARKKWGYKSFIDAQYYNEGSNYFLGDEPENKALLWKPMMNIPKLPQKD